MRVQLLRLDQQHGDGGASSGLAPGVQVVQDAQGNWVQATEGDLMGMYTPGREPVSQDRSLDGLSTSMFNPGGTKRVLSFGGLGNVKNTRANKDKETEEFLARRRQEIEQMNETYHRLNHDINILVLSKESQEDENHLEKSNMKMTFIN